MQQRILGALGGVLALGMSASPATAGTFLAMDLPDLVADSHSVVLGEIVDVESFWTSDGKVIVTEATVVVEERLIGESPDEVRVRTFGGTVGEYQVVAHGFPVFDAGEHVVLFLQDHPEDRTTRVTGYQLGHYRVIERAGKLAVVPTVDQGAYFISADGREAIRPIPYELSTFASMLRESTSILDDTK